MMPDKLETADEHGTMVFCECGSEAIQVSWWEDDPEVFLSNWSHGSGGIVWRHRLKHIWQILRKGHPYTDSVILSPDEAKKLADALSSAARMQNHD